MTKTKPEIAKAILERRNRMTHVIMPGEINGAIGPDGVAEALEARWLVPDVDTGFLCATNDLGKIEEMRRLAEMKPEQYQQPPMPVCESHDMTIQHTHRPHSINEIAAPMTGGSSPGLTTLNAPQPAQAMAPQRPTPATGSSEQSPTIGNSVMVARNGVSSMGVIEKILPDGRYQLGFAAGQQKAPPGDGIFSKEEMSTIDPNTQRSPVTAP
jgi:hypothetical protein